MKCSKCLEEVNGDHQCNPLKVKFYERVQEECRLEEEIEVEHIQYGQRIEDGFAMTKYDDDDYEDDEGHDLR